MAEDATTDTTEDTGTAAADTAGAATTDTGKDWRAEADKWKAHARKHEAAAKANAEAAAKLAEFEAANATEQEKAVKTARDEADKAARADERGKAGARLVQAEFKAVLAGRVDPKALPDLLSGINHSQFLTDDGEVDSKAVEKFANALAPAKTTSFDGGARRTAKTADMNDLIRQAAGYA